MREEAAKNQKFERKFIVTLPDLWVLSNQYVNFTVKIKQTFLRNKNKDGDCHVRREKINGQVSYYYSRKICDRERGLRIVAEEYEISREEYEELIKTRVHPQTAVIEKTRYVFDYKEQTFNLDILSEEVINEDRKTLLSKKEGILMIELPFPEEHLELPRSIFIQSEITNDMSYTTKALAKVLMRNKN